jgi:HlyD family secretion protein
MPGRYTMHWKAVLVGVAVLAALGGIAAMRARGPEVAVRAAERRPVIQTVVASGRVAAPAQINVGATILGRAARVVPQEGSSVAAGDVLVELEDAEARAALAQAQAAVQAAEARRDVVRRLGGRVLGEEARQAQANLALAGQRLQRLEALGREGAATAEDLDQARTAHALARSRLESARLQASGSAVGGAEFRAVEAALAQARASLDAARARLDQARILAPADGVVLRRAVEPGDVVPAGAPLLVLAARGAPELVVQPDEKNLRLLRVDQAGLASADAFPGLTFPVRIRRIAPAVDRQRGTVEVRLDVPDPPDHLRPDMTVSVEIEVGRRADALVVPEESLREPESRRPWVLVVADGRVEKRPVQVGLRGDAVVEVTEGLAAGDAVVVAEGGRLRPGDRVRPRQQE